MEANELFRVEAGPTGLSMLRLYSLVKSLTRHFFHRLNRHKE